MDEAIIKNREEFDEQAYIDFHEDVRRALGSGVFESAWLHYERHGRAEGRRAFRKTSKLDENFYLRAYPVARREIAAGLAANPLDHYTKFGRGRGFLPALSAGRPDFGAALPSAFGGLWPDAANALDVIEGKLEIGQIDESDAALLRDWVGNGYVTLRGMISPELIDAAAADLEKAYAGGFKKVLFECHKVGAGNIHWDPAIERHPAKVLDLHHFSRAMRNIMFAPAVGRFLGLIFESRALATQSLGFLRGSGQEGHQDSAYVPFTLPRSFTATWIALEDVTIGGGELFYYVGSHKFPDFLYGGRYKSIAEAERNGYQVAREEVSRHVDSLRERAAALGMEKSVFAAKKGDVLVWHADLVHGGNRVSGEITRKSFVTHYCPRRIAPLFAERTNTELYDHDGHLMTSHLYPRKDFVD